MIFATIFSQTFTFTIKHLQWFTIKRIEGETKLLAFLGLLFGLSLSPVPSIQWFSFWELFLHFKNTLLLFLKSFFIRICRIPSYDYCQRLDPLKRNIDLYFTVTEHLPRWRPDVSLKQGANLYLWSFAIPQLLFYNSYSSCMIDSPFILVIQPKPKNHSIMFGFQSNGTFS